MFDLTLTFDNGPEPAVTPGVLDILATYGIKSTFFVLGRKIADPAARRAAARAHDEGHWIGNHTWSHSGPFGRRPEADLAEIEIARTEREIGALAHPRKLFRPQGGGGSLGPHLLTRQTADYLRAEAFTCVLWNAVPRDWVEPDAWVERALDLCASQPWTLMVLHDLPTGAMRHLPRFLDVAGARGAQFRQDFPPGCMPIVDGRPALPLDGLTTTTTENGES